MVAIAMVVAMPKGVPQADGSLKEQAARGLLKSVRIERGRVVAVFSPT